MRDNQKLETYDIYDAFYLACDNLKAKLLSGELVNLDPELFIFDQTEFHKPEEFFAEEPEGTASIWFQFSVRNIPFKCTVTTTITNGKQRYIQLLSISKI